MPISRCPRAIAVGTPLKSVVVIFTMSLSILALASWWLELCHTTPRAQADTALDAIDTLYLG